MRVGGRARLYKIPNVEEGRRFGDMYREKGVCVIVRPNYNEKDDKGTFYREWRSFNGEELKEVVFRV